MKNFPKGDYFASFDEALKRDGEVIFTLSRLQGFFLKKAIVSYRKLHKPTTTSRIVTIIYVTILEVFMPKIARMYDVYVANEKNLSELEYKKLSSLKASMAYRLKI